MTEREAQLAERFVSAVEQIANQGIDVYLRTDDSVSSEKMALDLAAMKIGESLESVAAAISNLKE